MIERLEVTPGTGTVIRYGGIVAWVDAAASPALISFLAQSARNLGPSPRGGRQIADHIAGVLTTRDPEPHVGFAVLGPSDHGWATLLHGPAQAWDGAKWLAPARSPGWVQAIITARPTVTVGPAGAPLPPVQPDSMLDLEAGVVPGDGFLLLPAIRAVRVGPSVGGAGGEGMAAGEAVALEPTPAENLTEILTIGGAMAPPSGASSLADEQDAGPTLTPGGPDHVDAGLLAAAAARDRGRRRRRRGRPPRSRPSGPGRGGGTDAGAAGRSRGERDTLDRGDAGHRPGSGRGHGGRAGDAGARHAHPAGAAPDEPTPVPGAGATAALEPHEATVLLPRRRRRPERPGPPGSLNLESVSVDPSPPLPHAGGPDPLVPGLPLVAGVLCSHGHLNRAGLPRCVKCGRPIDEAERRTGQPAPAHRSG